MILPPAGAVPFSDDFFNDRQTKPVIKCIGLCGFMIKNCVWIFCIFHMDKKKIPFICNGKIQKRRLLPGSLTALNAVIQKIEKQADKCGGRNPDLLWKKNITGKCDAQILTFRLFSVQDHIEYIVIAVMFISYTLKRRRKITAGIAGVLQSVFLQQPLDQPQMLPHILHLPLHARLRRAEPLLLPKRRPALHLQIFHVDFRVKFPQRNKNKNHNKQYDADIDKKEQHNGNVRPVHIKVVGENEKGHRQKQRRQYHTGPPEKNRVFCRIFIFYVFLHEKPPEYEGQGLRGVMVLLVKVFCISIIIMDIWKRGKGKQEGRKSEKVSRANREK